MNNNNKYFVYKKNSSPDLTKKNNNKIILTLLLLQGSDSVELFLDNDPLDALDEARDALFIWVQRSPRLRLYTSFSA